MASKRSTKEWWWGLALLVLGALIVGAIHFITYKTPKVHYHANFALYINGQRDEFKNFNFYEEEAACNINNKDDAKSRAHMHDNNPGLVHVHADGVTWGYFFANLGYTLGDHVLQTPNGTYIDDQGGNSLTFILNGQTTGVIADKVIHDRDRLLINYGSDDVTTLQQRYNTVPTDAIKADTTADPAACSGPTKTTLGDRFKHAFVN